MKTAIKILFTTSIITAILALVMLIKGSWAGFFGALVISLGFMGLGWAGRRLVLPDINRSPRQGIGLVIGFVFGGAGSLMLAGSLLLFVDGDFAGGAGLLVFGLVFCAAAVIGARVFSIPKGTKEILVGRDTHAVHGVLGQSGQLTGGRYVYVDKGTSDADIETMQSNWAQKPWTQREDWAEGKVVQEGPGSMRLLVVFTVLWNSIAWSIAGYAILSEWNSPDVPWFVLVFPVFGIALIIMTLRTWIRKRKFGVSILYCKTMPAYLGERLEGFVQTGVPVNSRTPKEFCVRLICVRRSSVLDHETKQRVSEETLWSQKQTVSGTVSDKHAAFQVSVDIALPDNLPATELYPEDDRTFWRLEISCAVTGVDYAAQFEVPVYKRVETAPAENSI